MTNLPQILAANSGSFRLLLTLLVIGGAILLIRIIARYYQTQARGDFEARRLTVTFARNCIGAVAAVLVLNIWLAELRNFALSVAAIGAGILIVSKELLMCALGSVMRATTRSYSTGDVIELTHLSGKVLSYNFITTTLLDQGPADQYTGQTTTFPNSLLLTQPVRNKSATGKYSMEFLRIPVPADADLRWFAGRLQQAGEDICGIYQEEAAAHFERLEQRHFINLPSIRPKVLIEHKDAKEAVLVLRYPAVADKRVSVGQDILRQFYELAGRLPKA